MANYIVGLDIGSKNIKALVAETRGQSKLKLIKVIKLPSGGVRKGTIDDMAEATYAVNSALGEIKKIAKDAIKNIYLAVGNSDISMQPSTGSVAVSRADNEISQEDISRAVEASRAISLPMNRMILHAITREFVVDRVSDISEPLGMMGNKLEVNSTIIDAFAPAIKNLTKCVEISGGGVSGLILGNLASARAVLNKNQKELGVVLLDIGFGKTGLSIYQENKLLHTAIFPIGSGNITNDLAIGLKTSIATADTIKYTFGSAIAKDVDRRDSVDLQKVDAKSRGNISRRFIAEIIEARLAEIFEFVNNELKRFGKNAQFPSGIVIVGGGAKLPSLIELAKQELRLPAQVGIPDLSSVEIMNAEVGLQLEDPEFASALGLLIWGSNNSGKIRMSDESVRGILKKVLGYFIP
ncbi:MAG: cell division protein FtsA [bacterium]|nr:cell division protein FtsA [bacterium]